jgi:uncharacterized lipoprotein YddW (UPF0748 family)
MFGPRCIPVFVLVVLAVLLPMRAAGAEPPGPASLPAIFGETDDAAARAAWRPMAGTAAVSAAEVDGRKAVRMPCNFRGTKFERASWDRAVRLDLAAGSGVEFKFFARDPSPVSHFSLYFESGEGWYAATFGPTEKGRWCTVRIYKDETRIEGRPAGWADIRTIRISAWRGKDEDAEFFLADFAPLGARGKIAVVRGDSAARDAPGEVDSACEFAGAVARCLRDLGVEYSFLSDLDAKAERLAGFSLAILPHNPAMPDAAADALAKFAAGGGKLIAFYTLAAKLRAAAGIEGGGHVTAKYGGQFASIHFEPDALAGAPPVVGQQSWNIQDARPAEGRSRVAARWFDREGKDTGYPAVLMSDNCIYMTHVLIADDMAAKRRMLLAMVGRFVPEAWKQAAGARVAEVERRGADMATRIGPSAVAALRPVHLAMQENAAAAGLLGRGRFAGALDQADTADRHVTEAWCAAQPSVAGEFRGAWCHSAFGPQGMEWDEAIKVLADNGFTAVLPNMLWGGTAYYESAVLPVAREVAEKGDQVARCLAACRKHGLQCHVWKVNWNMGGRASREFAQRMKREGRTQVGFDGRPLDAWLCPSHPENRKLEIASMVEVATKYDVDGIHFDYIRYPDADHCFCPGCRARFEEAAGEKVANWPADVRRNAGLRAKWLDFRRSNITAVVAAVSEQVRKLRPKCRISAAVFSNWPVDRDGVGQDWKVWCDRGYLDFVCPMDYTPHTAQFDGMVAAQLPLAGRAACYPGIGLSTWQPPTDVCKLIDQVLAARRLGARGFTVFEYSAATAREVLPLCGKGITRRE